MDETSNAGSSPVDRKVRQRSMRDTVTAYWLKYYCADHCTLCGNRGWLDTTGTRTAAGIMVGRANYCICPNGQALRAAGFELPNPPAKRAA